MTDISRQGGTVSYAHSMHTRPPVVVVLFFLGMLCLLATLITPLMPLSAGLLVAGAIFVGGSVFMFLLNLYGHRKQRAKIQLTKDLVCEDQSAHFITTNEGRVLYRNEAGSGLSQAQDMLDLLRGYSVTPETIVRRIQGNIASRGYAREDIRQDQTTLTITARKITDAATLWRFEETSEEPAAVRLAKVTSESDGTIRHMNDAFRDLVGAHVTHLDRVFRQLPVETDKIQRIRTALGPADMRVVEMPCADGARDIYLLPAKGEPAETTANSDACVTVDNLPVPLLKLGLAGDIMEANQAARDLLQSEIPTGTRMSALLDGLGSPIPDWIAQAIKRKGRIQPQFLQGAGARRGLFVQVALCAPDQDDPDHVIAVMHDGTEFKTLEAQAVQSQKMQAIGQLAGGVAHDFNNLLTAISGHCDLLLMRHTEGDNDYGDLEQISLNTSRAAVLVGQLLAYSRKQELRLEPVEVSGAMRELIQLLNRLLGERVKLELKIDANLPAVIADKQQFEQVVMNLVVNARDAMPDGGTVRIEAAQAVLNSPLKRDKAVVPAGNYVVVRVVDQGTGIPPEVVKHIFEPFYTTKPVGEGTGLGLSTAYGIMKQSNGFIFVDSKVKQGTTFTLYLPAHSKSLSAAAPVEQTEQVKDEKDGADTSGVILLVEDEAPVRTFASRALQMQGYEVVEADCGEAALEIVEENNLRPDLIVSDVVMPGIDGPAWVSAAMKHLPNTKVVFVSGYSEDSIRENRADVPNSVFLPKPFSLADLTATVKKQIKTD